MLCTGMTQEQLCQGHGQETTCSRFRFLSLSSGIKGVQRVLRPNGVKLTKSALPLVLPPPDKLHPARTSLLAAWSEKKRGGATEHMGHNGLKFTVGTAHQSQRFFSPCFILNETLEKRAWLPLRLAQQRGSHRYPPNPLVTHRNSSAVSVNTDCCEHSETRLVPLKPLGRAHTHTHTHTHAHTLHTLDAYCM